MDTALAIAKLWRMLVALDLLSTGVVRGAIQGVRRWRRDFAVSRSRFCGLPVSFGQSKRAAPPRTDAPAIAGLAGAGAEYWARSFARPCCASRNSRTGQPVVEALTRHGYFRVPSMPACTLAIGGATFEEYVGAMRAGSAAGPGKLEARGRLGLTVRLVPAWEAQAGRILPAVRTGPWTALRSSSNG